MTVQELLKKCQAEKTAVLATNFYNFETLTAVMKAASKVQAPVMLQLTRSSIDYMGLKVAVRMARQAIEDYGVQGCIHLDHGPSIELVQKCLDAGFESVMIDASEKPFEENVETTCKVVEMAKPYKASVEAELGYVAKLGQEQGGGFTTPEDAARFVEATGVDALAVAIGSAHGFYKLPIPHDQVREAIANGIVKVNLATEIKDTFMRALKTVLTETNEIDLRKVFPKAVDPVVDLLCDKYRMVGTAAI